MPNVPTIELAVQAAGTLTELARLITAADPDRPVLPQHITNWRKRGVPADRCFAIERATGVTCEQLRDDVTWLRDAKGRITGYQVPLAAIREPRPNPRRKAA